MNLYIVHFVNHHGVKLYYYVAAEEIRSVHFSNNIQFLIEDEAIRIVSDCKEVIKTDLETELMRFPKGFFYPEIEEKEFATEANEKFLRL